MAVLSFRADSEALSILVLRGRRSIQYLCDADEQDKMTGM